MTTDVQICNLALSHLGDTANLSSIDPPEGSAQAEHCARFYPVARNLLQESFEWGFATTRSSLSQLVATIQGWDYVYAVPNKFIKIVSILPQEASDLHAVSRGDSFGGERFVMETLSDGTMVICTNVENATARYTRYVEDTTKFPQLFVMALTYQLASMIAGPLLKGDAGAAESKRCEALAMAYAGQAASADAYNQNLRPQQVVQWMAGR